MVGISATQNSFLGGEIAPEVQMRFDKNFYPHSCASLQNLMVRVQGSTETRPGSWYIDDLEGPCLLVEWVFSAGQEYLMVFTDGQLDVYDNTSGVHLRTITSGVTWKEGHLDRLNWTQQLDTMIVTHPDAGLTKILRTGYDTFTLSPFAFDENTDSPVNRILQPHYKYAPGAVTISASGTTGSVTLTASSSVFVSGHVGTRLRIKAKEVLITAVASGTSATATVKETLTGTSATTDWTEQVFSSVRGWPHSIVFYGDRLTFGGAKGRPLGIWFSCIGKYFNFDVGTSTDSDAIWDQVGEAHVSEVRHLIADRHLIVLCDAGEYMVANTETTPLTPKNFKIPSQGAFGASYCRPHRFDGGVIYVQNETNIARIIRYNDIDQRYQMEALNLVAPHLVSNPDRMASTFATAPRQEHIAMLVNDDGRIGCCVSEKDNGVTAWVPWQFGGGWLIRDVCVVRNRMWAAVERDDVWRLCRIDWEAPPLDMGVSATSVTATKTFAGFGVFASQTVDCWSNGYALGQGTVSAGGTLTLAATSPAVKSVTAGFAFTQLLQQLPWRQDLRDGPSHGRILGISEAIVDCVESGFFYLYGRSPPITVGDVEQEAPNYTGIVRAYVLGYDQDAAVSLTVTLPQRISIRGITRRVVIGG